jgi:hypothetical protein
MMNNGAWLALGVVGAVAAAGRVTRGSFARDWRSDARYLLAFSEEEGGVDSGDLSDLLERIVEDRTVTGYPRSRAVRILLDAQEEGYLDTGDALGAVQEALTSGSRSVGGGARYVAVVAGQPIALPRSVSHSHARSRDYARKTYGVDHVELVAGKGGSRSVYGMSPDAAGRTLRLGFGRPRSNAAEALNDYRWHPERALAQYTASAGKKGKGKGGSRAFLIDDPEYTHYVVYTPSMKIASGWSYAEDAKDALADMGSAKKDCKVYTRKYLKDNGRDPRHNDNWSSHGQF